MEINPFGVLKELYSIVEARHPEDNKNPSGSALEKLYAEKLYEAFLAIVDEFVEEDDEEIAIPENLSYISSGDEDDNTSDDDELKVTSPFATKYEEDRTYKSPPPPKRRRASGISHERKLAIIGLWDQHPKWNWQTLKRQGCSEIPNQNTLYRWRRQVRLGKNSLDKVREISQFTYDEMMLARASFKIVRSSHLRSFAMQKFMELKDENFKNFKGSKSWLDKFKMRHKITSRKITRLVSKREIKSDAEIIEAAENFQAEIRALSQNFDDDHIFNTDQCGFQYELTSQRTFAKKGEKHIFGYAQSPKNLSTHSYTVQYLISMAGEIVGKVFICLQEVSGKLGPIVKQNVDQYLPCNVTLTCSSSGKMSTSLNEYYIEKQIVPNVSKQFLHIVDSWSGHTNIGSYDKFFGESNDKPEITLKVIPEKCTPLAQPLDTTFHRQLKYLAREILAALEIFINVHCVSQDDNWNTRQGVIKLQSFLHFQLTAPIFKPMIQYSWFSSGLTTNKPTFKNVKEVCFTFDDVDRLDCSYSGCNENRFMKCSHCRQCICIKHLWLESHFDNCEESPFFYQN